MTNKPLISFEGIHGSGKTTVLKELQKKFIGETFSILTSLDIQSNVGKELRRIDVSAEHPIDDIMELFFVGAVRRDLAINFIEPALNMNSLVIVERFLDAFFAFSYARGTSSVLTDIVAKEACHNLVPSLTILFDLPPEVAVDRLSRLERHRVENEPLTFHQRLRDGYLKRCGECPDRIRIIDSNRPIHAICSEVYSIIMDTIK